MRLLSFISGNEDIGWLSANRLVIGKYLTIYRVDHFHLFCITKLVYLYLLMHYCVFVYIVIKLQFFNKATFKKFAIYSL